MMLKFEIKKVFSKARNKVAVLVLLVVLVVVSMLTINRIEYTDASGNSSTGITAATKLRQDRNQWAGYLTKDVFKTVYRQRNEIVSQKTSNSIEEENKLFHQIQGTEAIADLINNANSPWQEYDYYAIEKISEDDAANVYEKRISNLKDWLASGEEHFSKAEQDFLIKQYQDLKTPFYYEYFDGWSALLQNLPTFMMILALFIGYFIADIFSNEFQTKADSIYFSTKLGRNKAIWSKIGAGFLITTVTFIVFVTLYTIGVLLVCGIDGMNCPIQFVFWRSCYNITIFQTYLLLVLAGYIGTLFAAVVAMLASALTRSTVIAIMMPFIILCAFPFLSRIMPLPEICSFFPDRLLDAYNEIRNIGLVEIKGHVTTILNIIMPVYTVVSLILIPVIYQRYKKIQIK